MSIGRFPKLVCSLLFSLIPFSVNAENIIVYADYNYPPLIYIDNGKPAGILPAIFKRLEKDTGDTYELVLLPWKRALLYSERDKGGITTISRNAERDRIYDFSEPIYDDAINLVVVKGREFDFNSLKDLHGKVLGGLSGASYGETVDKAINIGEITVERDNNQESRLLKLLAGRIDVAIIGNGLIGLEKTLNSDYELKDNIDEFVMLKKPLTSDPLHLAFSKTMHMKPALKRFDKAMKALMKTDEYQQLILMKF